MRFDEIDLIGDFKIAGLTGDSGKAIGFSGSNIEWIDAASGGTPANALSTSGYNYVIVEATGTPTENGETLYNVIQSLSSYFNGTLSDQNRFQVLLMPGEYDMSTSGYIAILDNYVDIVGISSNPYDTVISRSDNDRVYRVTDKNSGLYNLYFKSGYIQEDTSMTYMKWKNIVLGDLVFNGSYILTDMIGEFEDITILGACHFAQVTNNINGIFNNIRYVGADSNAFFTAGVGIVGTFSNIFANIVAGDPLYASFITARFENITINNSNTSFTTSGSLTGTYKNITIKNCGNAFTFLNDDANTRFEDITIDNCDNQAFYSSSGTINGKYKNIKIGENGGDCFIGDFSNSAVFENIEIGVIKGSGSAFLSSATFDGTFNNITIGNVPGSSFQCISSYIYGTYSNIEVGNVQGNFFKCNGDFIANIKNIKTGNLSGGYNFSTENGTIYQVKAENITLGDCNGWVFSNRTGIEFQGNFKNITTKNINGTTFYIPSGGITASNIQLGNVNDFLSTGSFGTRVNLKDIKMGDANKVGDAGGTYNITSSITNITIGNVTTDIFSEYLPTNVRNMTVGNIGGNCFLSDVAISGIYLENITVGNVGKDFIVATSSNLSTIQGTFRNIKAGNIVGSAFSAYAYISSNMSSFSEVIIKDVEISSCKHIFRSNQDGVKTFYITRIENVGVGTCSTAFQNSTIHGTSEIKNFSMTGVFSPDAVNGMVERSYFNQSDRNTDFAPAGSTGRFERNKILVQNTRQVSFVVGQIAIYNLVNYGTIGNIFGSASNVIDSDVTP